MKNIELTKQDVESFSIDDAMWYEDGSFFEFFDFKEKKRYFIRNITLTDAISISIAKRCLLSIQPENQDECIDVEGYDIKMSF